MERSDNVADRDHAFAVLKRGYPRRVVIVKRGEMHSLRYARAILCSVFPTAAVNAPDWLLPRKKIQAECCVLRIIPSGNERGDGAR